MPVPLILHMRRKVLLPRRVPRAPSRAAVPCALGERTEGVDAAGVVEVDLVVQRAEDMGDGALFFDVTGNWNGQWKYMVGIKCWYRSSNVKVFEINRLQQVETKPDVIPFEVFHPKSCI